MGTQKWIEPGQEIHFECKKSKVFKNNFKLKENLRSGRLSRGKVFIFISERKSTVN